jgi:pyroglutamyl-peptidase
MKHVETAARPVVILVTGFGAFPGARTNPSAAILDRLRRHRPRLARLGVRLEIALLPVVFAEVGAAVEEAAAAIRPDVILHIGLASRRRAVSIETRARTRAGTLHPDASRCRPAAMALATPGAPLLRATYPAPRLVAAIRAMGVTAKPSIDAGDYVCNAVLYHTLSRRLAPVAGFIHVPRLAAKTWPSHRVRRHRPSLDALATGVLATLPILACAARGADPR